MCEWCICYTALPQTKEGGQTKSLSSSWDKIAELWVTVPPHKRTNMSKVGKRWEKDKIGWRCCLGWRRKGRERVLEEGRSPAFRLSFWKPGGWEGFRAQGTFLPELVLLTG